MHEIFRLNIAFDCEAIFQTGFPEGRGSHTRDSNYNRGSVADY